MRHSYIGASQWFGVTFLSMIQETIIDIIQFGNAGTLLLFRLISSFRRLGILFHSSILYKMTKKTWHCCCYEKQTNHKTEMEREKKKLRNEMKKQKEIHFGSAIKYHHRFRSKRRNGFSGIAKVCRFSRRNFPTLR